MYRILIADDEPLEREGMSWIINNMNIKLEIIEAENGRDALQKAVIYQPHIIFMDIRMPGMDGLTALQQIKAELPNSKCVLVTAYDDFTYAQKAIRLTVSDYLIKPAKRSEITALLERLITSIEEEEAKFQQYSAQQAQLNELMQLVKAELALGLIAETIDESQLRATAESLQIPLYKLCSLVIALPKSEEPDRKFVSIPKKIEQELHKDHIRYFCSTLVQEHIVWFVSISSTYTDEDIMNIAQQLGHSLLNHYRSVDPFQDVLVGIGGHYEGITGARRSYYEAVFASTKATKLDPIVHFQHMESNITQPLMHTKVDQFQFVQKAISLIQQEREQQTFSMMDTAIHYIERHYQREITLEEVADYVHLNSFYFSKVFKQQTGETFIDYVTRVRINHAKKLMNNKEHSLKEICYMVGYNDPNYFSRVFKKVTGMKPSEYRTSSKI